MSDATGITIALVVLLCVLALIPFIFYLRIILNFLLDRDLQNELMGKGAAAGDDHSESRLPKPAKLLLSFENVT